MGSMLRVKLMSTLGHYKGFFSVILPAVVSSDYKFLWIDVSGKGSFSDAHIYNESEFKEGLQNNDIAGFPQPDPLQVTHRMYHTSW